MDPPDDFDPAGRARRAVPLIAIALTVAVVAGLLYLRPAPKPTAAFVSPSPSPPTLAPAYAPAYDFVTPSLGWAVLENVVDPRVATATFWIFRTDDSAGHWKLQFKGSVDEWPEIEITFFDSSHGVVVFGAGTAYRTADGGAHWLPVKLPPVVGVEIAFADPVHAWFAGAEVIDGAAGPLELYRTSDAGAAWARLPDPPAGAFSFRSTGEGWAAVERFKGGGDIYSTWDGGQTWDRVTLPAPTLPENPSEAASVRLLPRTGVLAVDGFNGFLSFDHGTTWRELASPPAGATFDQIAFQDASHWWAMPSGNLYRTSDAGRTWQHIKLQIDDWRYDLGVIDSRHAWALLRGDQVVGGTGMATALALTSDGGLNWKYPKVPVPG